MKHYLITGYLLIVIFIVSCKVSSVENTKIGSSNTAMSKDQEMQNLMKKERDHRSSPSHTYDTIPSMISYYDHYGQLKNRKFKNGKAHRMFYLKRQTFLNRAIPPAGGPNSLKWEQGMTWQKADKIYRDFLAKHKDHPWINIFKQNGVYEILVRLNLLADTSEIAMTKIAYYLNQLATSNSANMMLENYGIRKLKGRYPTGKLVGIAQKMLKSIEQTHKLEKIRKYLADIKTKYSGSNFENLSKSQKESVIKGIKHYKNIYILMSSAKKELEKFVSKYN